LKISLTPILLAVEITFFVVLALRTDRLGGDRRESVAVGLYLVWIAFYGVVVSAVGARGLYVSDALLRWLPGFWIQLVTVAACVVPVVLFERVRDGLRRIVDTTPWHWFAYFHGMRVAAVGTAYKTILGEFPAYFELLVGIPDLAFGVSAFWIGGRARRGQLSRRGFFCWNLVGIFVIVPAAPILLQLGLPGPIQIFEGVPDARVILTHPMSIAPMLGVPLFVLVNLLVAWRLWEGPVASAPR
jgi:hypothetical protein